MNAQLAIEQSIIISKYNELIMTVASKFPNETRHETALRYINEAERRKNNFYNNLGQTNTNDNLNER
jgi:hypothetical protein